jgi:hypothetical protein
MRAIIEPPPEPGAPLGPLWKRLGWFFGLALAATFTTAAAIPAAVATVIPPIATQGISMSCCQPVRSSGSARVGASLVVVGKKAPKAT